MKFAWACLSAASAASVGEQSSLSTLIDFAQESSPRKAQQLLQTFAKNTLARAEEVDDVTKQKLREIGAQLTNNTWMALEQSHRRDQDLLDKHWRAIEACGDKHIAHRQQDIDGFEVQQVRTHEADMIMCRGLPDHTLPKPASLLQEPGDDNSDDPYDVWTDNRGLKTHAEVKKHTKTHRDEWWKDTNGHVNVHQNGIDYVAPDTTLPDDYDTMAWLADTPFAVYKQEDGSYQRFFKHVSNMYTKEGGKYHGTSLLEVKNKVCEACGDLDEFLKSPAIATKNCEPAFVKKSQDPKCTTAEVSWIETDLEEWFSNLIVFSDLELNGCKDFNNPCSGEPLPLEEDPEQKPTCKRNPVTDEEVTGRYELCMKSVSVTDPDTGETVQRELPSCDCPQSRHFEWTQKHKACKDARAEYIEMDAHCDKEQEQYEDSFCAYRQGLHATCAEYQGCYILTEEEFLALITDTLYAADSRKIDWKAIHKIACYIKVLVSDKPAEMDLQTHNEQRTLALENCESGNLNTLATILTGFNETNYLSLIIPEISGNVSCWDLEVPPLIDFKECDMSSVHQYPCTDTWEKRYAGLESPRACEPCAELPEHAMYSDNDYQKTDHYRKEDYGGGWIFVNELGRSATDIDDLVEIQPTGYYLPSYNMKGLRYNEVLVQRTSANWCDSWGRETSKWVEDDGASMCVQADKEHVYCMNNHDDKHTWSQQPVSHFAALCGKGGESPVCECWPWTEGLSNICFADHANNVPADRNLVNITSLEEDGSVVKVSFHGQEKTSTLKVGNYGAFLDGVGCGAVTPVSYRVFVRCLGCVTERSDFHSKDGAQFNGVMTMGKLNNDKLKETGAYTYEAWFRSPLDGHFDREIFGGSNSGFVLAHGSMHNVCSEWGDSNHEKTSYQLHVGGTNVYSTFCFRKNAMYHVAVTKHSNGTMLLYVNGQEATFTSPHDTGVDTSAFSLTNRFGDGFTDGGQLFNVRIWSHARTKQELLDAAAITESADLLDQHGLVHWWPLTDDVQDSITTQTLKGKQPVRYAPVWCSDLEATGMRVC